MSPELIAILAVGVALGGVILQGMHGLNRRMDSLDKRMDGLDKRIDGLEKRIDSLEERLRAVEAGLAEIKGQLTIVRDYIAGRNMRADDPPAAPAE